MHFRKVSFKTVAFSSLEKLKKTILDIFFQHTSYALPIFKVNSILVKYVYSYRYLDFTLEQFK